MLLRRLPYSALVRAFAAAAAACLALPAASAQDAPRISRSPGSGFERQVTIIETQAYSLNVFFTSATPATVRWYRDGVLVSEQPNVLSGPSQFDLAAAALTDLGTYWAEVTNAAGTAQSDLLTVIVRPGERPYFVAGPVGVTPPYPTIDTPLLGGDQPLSFQWLRDGAPLAGQTYANLPIATLAGGTFTLRVRNPWGEVVSPAMTLPLATASAGPLIVREPSTVLGLDVGSDYALAVSTASSGVTYQWYKEGQPLAGETRDTLSFKLYDPGKAGRYYVVLTDGAGNTTRSTDSLVQTHPGHEAPTAAVLPGTAVARTAGQALTLVGRTTGIATEYPMPSLGGGLPPPQLQWLHNGAPIAGATSARLFLPRIGPEDAGTYVFVADDGQRRAQSAATTVTVSGSRPALAPFVLSRSDTESSSVSFDVDRPLAIGAQVLSDLPVTFQWYRNGTLLDQFTGPEINLTNARLSDAGLYVLVARNSAGALQAYAQQINIRDDGQPRFLDSPPAKVLILPGNAYVPSLRYTANPNIVWKKDGATIYSSVQNPGGFSIPFAATSPGTYTAELQTFTSSGVQVAKSTPVVVTLASPDAPGIYAGTADLLFGRRSWVTDTGLVAYIRPDRSAIILSAGGMIGPSYLFDGLQLDLLGRTQFTEPAYKYAGATPVALTAQGGSLTIVTVADPNSRHLNATRVVSGELADRAGHYQGRVSGTDGGDVHAVATADGHLGVLAVSAGQTYGGYAWLKVGEVATVRQGLLPGIPSIEFAFDPAQVAVKGVIHRSDGTDRAFSAPLVEGPLRSRLGNLASRGFVGRADQTMIAGFTLTGTGRLPVLVRGVGPALQQFGVTTAIDQAHLGVFQAQDLLAHNDSWATNTGGDVLAAAARVGAFALPAGSADAALLGNWTGGSFTAQVTNRSNQNGIGLVEVYDAGAGATASAQLTNLSVRGYVGSGQSALIAGITVSGTVPQRLLLRAVGPGLAPLGLTGVLSDPFLRVYCGDAVVAENNDWGGAVGLVNAATAVAAFALTNPSRDAALIVSLPPGTYTAVVTGNEGVTGIALIEVYALP